MTRFELIAIAAAFGFGCKGAEKAEKAEDKKPPVQTATGDAQPGAEPSPAGGQAPTAVQQTAPRQLEAPPPAKLLDKPVERRLYSDRIEASSFLWTDWNKFQENYHPNYILDGDPQTAWVEGADTSGAGEWVRIHVSPVEGATKIRLRIQNGYHKSKALYDKNARLKRIELVALPSGTKHTAVLDDAMKWQEIAFEQPLGKLEALELRAVEVVEGSKYTDLCVSDVELYVTGLTAENPAFEKSKLDGLLAWKKKRIEAAKLLGSAKAAALPVLDGYRVVRGAELSFAGIKDNKPYEELRSTLAELAKHTAKAPSFADAAKRATAGLESKFKGWVRVQVVTRDPIALPGVDGLREGEGEELVFGSPDDTFLLPASPEHGVLVRSTHLSVFDTKGTNPMDDSDCKTGKTAFMRPPRVAADGPTVRELMLIRCVAEDTREGVATYMVWQLLEFDAEGNLVLTAGPHHEVQWFEWQKREQGGVIAGGGRLQREGHELETLTPARAVAKK